MTSPPWVPDYLLPFWQADDASVLRALIMGEAEGEGDAGQIAVACVVRNRLTQHPGRWGESYQSVCLYPHQFTCFWRDWVTRAASCHRGLADRAPRSVHDAAAKVIAGEPDITDGADFYFSWDVVFPSWAPQMRLTVGIGRHRFYQALGVQV